MTLEAQDNKNRSGGLGEKGKGEKVLVEFVSADPTAPLSAQHGRGAAIGDALANLLAAQGFAVSREFYVNDITASSSLQTLARQEGQTEDALRDAILQEQKATLEELGVVFDTWQSERALLQSGAAEETLRLLEESGDAYERKETLWLRTTARGDEQDRVLRRTDGTRTYFAGDLAYHRDKFGRGFGRLVDVWTSEHQPYEERTRAGLAALGFSPEALSVVFCGPVRVVEDGQEVRGAGASAAPLLRDILIAVGPAAARLALLAAPPAEPLLLDLDKYSKESGENPLRLVEDAFQKLLSLPSSEETKETEGAFVQTTGEYPDVCALAAAEFAPQHLVFFVLRLAEQIVAWEGPLSASTKQAVAETFDAACALLGLRSS